MIKKIVIISGILICLAVAGLFVYVYTSAVAFSPAQLERMEAAISAPIEPQTGMEGFAMNGNTRIWYDVQTPSDSVRGTVVLIMGLSADALAWPKFFIGGLLNAGYQVVRLDNRGVGMSDWDDFDPDHPYSLSDMSDDVLAVLDTLRIERAHVCGVSLGGMIGQTLCIEHQERALSLTSMMSTPWIMDTTLPALNMDCFKQIGMNMMVYGLSSNELSAIKMSCATLQTLAASDQYELDIERIAQSTLYNLRVRNGYNRESGRQQSTAVERSGSRVEALKLIRTPTLVIHGKIDPLIPFEHGLRTAELIPNADTLWIDGLGHMLPESYSDIIVSSMVELFESSSIKDNAQTTN